MASEELEVTVERMIAVDPASVATIFFDPSHDTQWMQAVERAEPLGVVERFGVGTRVKREASFLGQRISWVTEVIDYDPSRRLVVKVDEGPFVGNVTYLVEDADQGSRVTIRNEGHSGTFGWMPKVMIVKALRSALEKDLAELEKVILANPIK